MRYIPARGENVIGVVVGKGGDTFRVDIGSADNASLSFMAFEGATKKNRPNINVGDVVYAKLLVASRDMEPELVCVDSYGKKGRDRLFSILESNFINTQHFPLTQTSNSVKP